MTLGVSTSSPVVSVALFEGATVIAELSQEATGAASGVVADMTLTALANSGKDLRDLTAVVVDVGPGGFTGVKVGVTFCKALAWARGIPLFTVDSFDLIATDRDVAIPSKRGEWYVRKCGGQPEIVVGEAPIGSVGYGPGREAPAWPNMANVPRHGLESSQVEPMAAVPLYIAEPSVSIPKNPHVLKGIRP